jgi:hypothetical protein
MALMSRRKGADLIWRGMDDEFERFSRFGFERNFQ